MFATEENGRIVTLFRENGTQGVFIRTRLGRRLYPHQTASGKAILSQLSESRVKSIIGTVGLPEATESTITDPSEFMEKLERTRQCGYAINDEKSTQGLITVAVLFAPGDTVIGTCSVSGPRHRMDKRRREDDIVGRIQSVVNELELNITHSQEST